MSYAYTGNGMDEFPCVVGEVGSYSTKIGFAGEDYPRSYFQSTTAVHRSSNTRSYDFMNRPLACPASSSSSPPSLSSQLPDEGWELENPVHAASGLVLPADLPLLSTYLRYGCHNSGVDSIAALPLLFIEKSYNPPHIRQALLQELMEKHGLPATFLARDAVCACYAVGRSTATVVDVGHHGTVITPVYDGLVENKGILTSPVGGRLIDELVLDTLDTLFRKDCMKKAKGHSNIHIPEAALPLYQTRMPNHQKRHDAFHHLARLDMARQCKEEGSGAGVGPFGYTLVKPDELSTISSTARELYQQYANAPKTPYKLPDGTLLHISQTLRFDVTECLFATHSRKRIDATSMMQQEVDALRLNTPKQAWIDTGNVSASPIPNLICESVYQCDIDQQPTLLGNVVLCGGGACLTTSAPLHSSSVTVDTQQNSMPERLREEVEALIHVHTPGWRVKVASPGITERAICSWLGGSILGSLGTFHEMWITKAEYEEHGSNIVHRKCP